MRVQLQMYRTHDMTGIEVGHSQVLARYNTKHFHDKLCFGIAGVLT